MLAVRVLIVKMFALQGLLVLLLVIVESEQNAQNNTVLIHTYSKVAHWGRNPSSNASQTSEVKSEGRSNGHTLWTHRSDANVVSGQNLKNKKPSVVYSYSISKKSDSDTTPQIQERFNPRPYFDYGKPPKKSSNGGDSTKVKASPGPSDDSNPSVVYGSPFASFPVFTKAQVSNPDDSDNLYDSPYSSYNPPEKPKQDKDEAMYNFPPLGPPAPADSYKGSDDYPGPPDDGADDMDNGGHGGNNKPPPPPPSNSYLPPPAPSGPSDMDQNGGDNDYPAPDDKPNNAPPEMAKYPGPYANLPAYNDDSDSYGPPDDHMPKPPSTAFGPMPPDHMPKPPPMAYGPMPPDHGVNSYGPPGHGHNDAPSGPPITQTVEPHQGYYDHGPPDYDAKHNYHYDHPVGPPAPPPPAGGDDMPPPNGAHGPPGYGNIPQYLDHDPKDHGYDFYGYDHHPVYHEVTTTTEAQEDMRVNKGQYSYYYLGRKLWYIPLYFSIYFIIYVTVLILKSIARHKVDFKHNLNDLQNKYRKSRNMELNDAHRNVEAAIEATSRKYEFM